MYLSKESGSLDKFKKRSKNRWLRMLRYCYFRIVRLQDSPRAIARGIACGVFAGSFPFFGLQIIIGVALAFFLRANKIAAAAGTWISNPFTYVPIFAFNYQIGCILLDNDLSAVNKVDLQTVSDLVELAKNKAIILSVGSAAVGSILAIFSYFLSLKLIIRWRKYRQFKYNQKTSQSSPQKKRDILQCSFSDRD